MERNGSPLLNASDSFPQVLHFSRWSCNTNLKAQRNATSCLSQAGAGHLAQGRSRQPLLQGRGQLQTPIAHPIDANQVQILEEGWVGAVSTVNPLQQGPWASACTQRHRHTRTHTRRHTHGQRVCCQTTRTQPRTHIVTHVQCCLPPPPSTVPASAYFNVPSPTPPPSLPPSLSLACTPPHTPVLNPALDSSSSREELCRKDSTVLCTF
jgi:hypothetical protein